MPKFIQLTRVILKKTAVDEAGTVPQAELVYLVDVNPEYIIHVEPLVPSKPEMLFYVCFHGGSILVKETREQIFSLIEACNDSKAD